MTAVARPVANNNLRTNRPRRFQAWWLIPVLGLLAWHGRLNNRSVDGLVSQVVGYMEERHPLTSSQQDWALIPFQSWGECQGHVMQASCRQTVAFDASSPGPLLDLVRPTGISLTPQWTSALCQQVLSANSTSYFNIQFPICFQSTQNEAPGVLVHKPKSTTGFDSAFQYVMIPKQDLRQWVKSAFASSSIPRVVDRTVVAMSGFYGIGDPHFDQVRAKDNNLGNIIWHYASTRLMNPATHAIQPIDRTNLQDPINVAVDTFLIATANILNLEKDMLLAELFKLYGNMVKNLRVPTILMGMGVQAHFGALSPEDVRTRQTFDYQKQLLSEIHKWQSAPAMGVRGQATATICENSGETHCVPVGCPTLFISRSLNLGQTLNTKWQRVLTKLKRGEPLNLVFTLPAFSPVTKVPLQLKHRDALGISLSNMAKGAKSSFWIQQMSYDRLNLQKWEREHGFKADLRTYHSVEDWTRDIAADTDLVISTRIHGGMAGVAAEIPTVVIATDFRILELVNAMRIPHLTMEDVHEKGAAKDVASVLKHARYQDFGAFEQNRRLRLGQWKDILATGDLELDPSLQRILDAPL